MRLAVTVTILLLVASIASAQSGAPAMVPTFVALREAASKAIAAEWLTDDERRDLRLRHGVWDERDLDTPQRRAVAALSAWRLDDPVFEDPSVGAVLRAEARVRAGDAEEALTLLGDEASIRAIRLRAEALEMLGRFAEADSAVEAASLQLRGRLAEADEITDGVLALMVRARVRGQPAKDFQTMITLLGRAHQDLDRLHWPSRVVEASLLLEKDNLAEGVAAAHEALALNPRAEEAWRLLGRAALRVFDFDGAARAIDALRRLDRDHPLALLLAIEMALIQDEPDEARRILAELRHRLPSLRDALALEAAAAAVAFDEEGVRAALERYDQFSPGSPVALHVAGRHLAFQRQYEWAAGLLEAAIERAPNWPEPRIELGLLELQSGRDARALAALEKVAVLDPYNKRCANSLFLLREMANHRAIESRHFIIRFRPGIDEVVARLMPESLDRMHEEVSGRFGHAPKQRTIIELMPDHQFFSVRIAGIPSVHTIAACTGPVIAMETPREGPPHLHLGPYDWLQVLRHEYAHTITLSQTRNRIPHWLTEAAAVSIESAPRKYETCQMLARELSQGTLFDLDEINWAFVRPRRAQDRSLAYAQGAWMVEYMNETMGTDAVVRLIERYFDGVPERRAIPEALKVSREDFIAGFLEWARQRVREWGLAATPTVEELLDRVRAADEAMMAEISAAREARVRGMVEVLGRRIGEPRRRGDDGRIDWPPIAAPPVEITDEMLSGWLAEFPDHPDLLELALRRSGRGEAPVDELRMAMLERYAKVRPVDPYPHRVLARHFLDIGQPQRAVEHLTRLDAFEVHGDSFAMELARLHREAGRLPEALEAVTKAVRINGYKAATRELAAAIAIEAGRLDLATLHLEALLLIEPDREIHHKRLEALAGLERTR